MVMNLTIVNGRIDEIIKSSVIRLTSFSVEDLQHFTDDPDLKNSYFSTIRQILMDAEVICDEARTLNETSFEHFTNKIKAKYILSEEAINKIYGYGMFVTR